MRLTYRLLLILGAAACSSAPDVQPQTPESADAPSPRVNTGGSMQLVGMPVMEAAELVHWQGSADVIEGVDGGKDTLELALSALDDSGKVEGSIHLSKQIDAQGGMAISGDYRLAEMGMNGQPNQLNVVVDGAIYRSISGQVTFAHSAGKVRGTFEAQLVRDGDATATPIALTGSFEGRMALSCHALRPATPDSNAEGGESEVPGQAVGPSWVPVHATHEFCRKYL